MTDTIHARMIRNVVARHQEGRSVAAGNLDTAWSFDTHMGLWVNVDAGRHTRSGDIVSFHGKASVSVTTGSESRLKGRLRDIPYTATYDLKHDYFSVKSQNEFFESAIEEACNATKKIILRDLREDKIIE
jgi:hypothetical protein